VTPSNDDATPGIDTSRVAIGNGIGMYNGFCRLVGGLLMIVMIMATDARTASAGPDAVVELFTSQGCSSCPAADALAARLSQSDNLVVLTLPVDYWDYLGWKDTLARHEHAQRQQAYSRLFGNAGVYTPQVVINGREHEIGSDERAIKIAIMRQKNRYNGLPVPLALSVDGEVLSVTVGAAADAKALEGGMATLWLVLYDRQRTVPIGRGENRGRTVTYTNVVRQMQPIGMWKGGEKRLDLPKDEFLKDRNVGCAVLLQREISGRPGPILGAAILTAGM